MKFKKRLIIPVLTTSIEEFVNRAADDPCHPVDISEALYRFLRKVMVGDYAKFRIPRLFDDWLCELVENIFDAYAAHGLTVGASLKITLKIKISEENAIISLHDNAGGFKGIKRGETFTLASIRPEKKDKTIFLGGEGVGLQNVGLFASKNNMALLFRNRSRVEGAVVVFRLPPQ